MEKLNNSNFNQVKECDFCVVDFSATWCAPCRMLKPILEEVADELNIKVFNVDVDESEDIARQFKIFSIPSIYIFKNGEVVDNMVGFGTKDEIIDFILKNK